MQSCVSEQHEYISKDDDEDIPSESSGGEYQMFANNTHNPFEMFDSDEYGSEEPSDDDDDEGLAGAEDEAELVKLSSGDFPLRIMTSKRPRRSIEWPRWLYNRNNMRSNIEDAFRPFILER
jgi:hypothetical protein